MQPTLKLDRTTILGRLGGDEELLGTMADMYLQEYENYCQGLRAAVQSGDAKLLQREAHTLKSLMATFADEPGSALALEIQMQAESGQLAGVEAKAEALEAAIRRMAAILEAEFRAG
ncbi:MAG: Hpt domain-containing protein [Betaproteobacteria bacterium]